MTPVSNLNTHWFSLWSSVPSYFDLSWVPYLGSGEEETCMLCLSRKHYTIPLCPRESRQVLKQSCFVKWGKRCFPSGSWHREFLLANEVGHMLAQVPTQSVENHYCVKRKIKQCRFYKLQGDAQEWGAVSRASQLGLSASQATDSPSASQATDSPSCSHP